MTSTRRFEQDLPALLDDLYVAGMPDYRDDLVATIARTPQRPAWTFPERWLPMDVVARRLPIPAVPWRLIVVTLLILILAAAALLVAVGSPQRVPPPFGPAGNGFLASSTGGDIVVRDALTGATRVLIGGVEDDSAPGSSPDGTLVGFYRMLPDGSHLMAASADGSAVRQLTTALNEPHWEQWAPDSRRVGVINQVAGRAVFQIVAVDGSKPVTVDLGDLQPMDFQWRPPFGADIAVRATDPSGRIDIFTLHADGTGLHPLGLHSNGAFGPERDLSGLAWSPSGDRIAYNVVSHDDPSGMDHLRIHLVLPDGTGDIEIPGPAAPGTNEAWPSYSPDGKTILAQRFTFGPDVGWLAVLPTDGSSPGRDIGPHVPQAPDSNMQQGWSPDGSQILLRFDTAHFYSIDPATGNPTPIAWSLDGLPDWRRVAP
jgi:Tol biopolymer transport system component